MHNAFKCEQCPQTFRTHLTLKTHKRKQHSAGPLLNNAAKETKAIQYTKEFKIKMIQRAAEIGIYKTSKENGIVRVALRGWRNKTEEKYKCETYGTFFEFESRLKTHIFKRHTKIRTNFKYTFNDGYRKNVVKLVNENSLADAVIKYNVSDATIRNWVKKLEEPFTCLICGTIYGYQKRIENHMRIKHKITEPLEQQEKYRKQALEIKSGISPERRTQ